MDFENHTQHNARFLNTAWDEHTMLGAVIARPTFRIDGQRLIETPERPWPIELAPMETPYGTFPGDVPFLTGGVDVFVVGSAYQPGGRPAPDLQIDIRVGERFHRAVDLFGDRVWQKRWGRLVPSEANPFVSLPLTYARAFGGRVPWEELDFAWPANPDGRGFILTEDQAEGTALPNLESPEHPIVHWEDHPDPWCPAPLGPDSALRPLNAVTLDTTPGEERVTEIKPLLFNHAHPGFIIDPSNAPRAGDWVEVTCVRPDGDLRFPLPNLLHHVYVQLEDRRYVFPLHLDSIGIVTEELQVVLGYRVVFTYALRALERRLCCLYPGLAPDPIPDAYVRAWED